MSTSMRDIRRFCFQYLFHLQLKVFNELKQQLTSESGDDELLDSIEEFRQSVELELDEKQLSQVQSLVTGVLKNYHSLEEKIRPLLKNWTLDRLPRVNLTILILGSYEICYRPELASSIIINEAVELAKEFGPEKSSAFINASLDNLAKQER